PGKPKGARAHGPVDQRGQFLLLPVHDLSRVARTARVSRTRHRIRREGGRPRTAEDRSGSSSLRGRTRRRAGLSVGFTAHACRLLSPAEYLRFRPDRGGHARVSEIFAFLPLAGANGGLADRATLPCCVAAARSDRARARVGGFASTKILIGQPGYADRIR